MSERGRALRALDVKQALSLVRALPFKTAYARWPEPSAPPQPGYTLLLPVPGDLPVFLRLAMANAVAQDPDGRVETLVIPDRTTPEIEQAFAACRAEFGATEGMRFVPIPPPGPALLALTRREPGSNHFLQIHTGVAQARGTHVLLHDADLFLTERDFLARHFRRASSDGLAVLGVSRAWDGWLADHGFGHVAATWELMADVAWMRSFAPWEHRQRFAWLAGEWHGFDTMYFTQARTPPGRIALHGDTESFVHFNWVITVYRMFRRSRGAPFRDVRFVLLFIRLMVDALPAPAAGGVPGVPVDVPSLDELVRGLRDASAAVHYTDPGQAGEYAGFREKIRHLHRWPLLDEAARARVEEALAPFDAAFG